jgi:hypothetical protein
MLVAVSVLSVVITEMQATGGLSQHGRLGQHNFGGSFRGSIPAGAEAAASERVGGLCRYSISYACSGIGIVGVIPDGQAGGLSQHGRVLDSTTLVDPFEYTSCRRRSSQHLKGRWLVPLLD